MLCRSLPKSLLLASVVLLALAGSKALSADGGLSSAEPLPFNLRDGDCVVLLGSTFIERDQAHGYLETALSSRFHRQKIQFRNLGWSGDNVFGEARARFGPVAAGFAHLKQHVESLEPTVIFVSYGANESFAGKAGLESFVAGFNVLLNTLEETKARVVFVTPLRQEDLGPPLPDPAAHNRDLKLYSDAIAAEAKRRQAPLVNLFTLLPPSKQSSSSVALTDNGIHLTAYGYWRAAPLIEQALGLPARRWSIDVEMPSGNIAARGATISDARFTARSVSFQALDSQLPLPLPPADAPSDALASAGSRVLRVAGLPSGKYTLKISGQEVATRTAQQWSAGVPIVSGPDFEQAEKLRERILAKNQLYFYRWRPQNETYLFGFRKYEQGKNAVEIPQFDPLVAAEETSIYQLSAPVAREYQLVRAEGK